MKALITLLASLMIISTCMADTDQQIQWRLDAQQARLVAIEKDIAAERASIGEWHARQLSNLRLAAEREARMLLASERVLMTALTTSSADAPLLVRRMGHYLPTKGRYMPEAVAIFHRESQETPAGFQRENEVFNGDSKTVKRLYDAMEYRVFLDHMTNLLLNENFRGLLGHMASSNEVKDADSNLLRSEARRLIAVMDRLDREAQYIEKTKASRLAALEEKANRLKADVRRVMHEIKTPPAAAKIGKIGAICMTNTGAFCMIDGVNGLVAKGAKIGDSVTVIDISEDKVTFQKVGSTWQQKVGQAPAAQWK